MLPGALRDFRQRMPRVSVSFNEVAPPHSHELLESGHYDLLVQTEYGGQIDDGFTRATLYDLPLAVGARVGHPLRARSAELHEALWLVPGNIESPSNLLRWPMPPTACRRPRCDPLPVHRRRLALIAESDALGIFVRDLFEHQLLPRPLRMVPLDHALPAARVCIVTRADSPPTPAAQCFMDCPCGARRARRQGGRLKTPPRPFAPRLGITQARADGQTAALARRRPENRRLSGNSPGTAIVRCRSPALFSRRGRRSRPPPAPAPGRRCPAGRPAECPPARSP